MWFSASVYQKLSASEPLISSLADADAILKELLQAERDVLPACWYE